MRAESAGLLLLDVVHEVLIPVDIVHEVDQDDERHDQRIDLPSQLLLDDALLLGKMRMMLCFCFGGLPSDIMVVQDFVVEYVVVLEVGSVSPLLLA